MVVKISDRLSFLFGDAQFRRYCVEQIKWKSASPRQRKQKNKFNFQLQLISWGDAARWKWNKENDEEENWKGARHQVSVRYYGGCCQLCAIIINCKLSRLAFGEMRNSMRLKTVGSANSIWLLALGAPEYMPKSTSSYAACTATDCPFVLAFNHSLSLSFCDSHGNRTINHWLIEWYASGGGRCARCAVRNIQIFCMFYGLNLNTCASLLNTEQQWNSTDFWGLWRKELTFDGETFLQVVRGTTYANILNKTCFIWIFLGNESA